MVMTFLLLIYSIFMTYIAFPKRDYRIEKLKNALFSFALLRVCESDIEYNEDIKIYNGDKIPQFHGNNINDMCFSYLNDTGVLIAINKYIDRNLNTEAKIFDFFNMFIDEIDYDTKKIDSQSSVNAQIESSSNIFKQE